MWDELESRGVKNVKVKGNLGAAATLKSGDEEVTTTEAEILQTKFGGNEDSKFKQDPAVLKIDEAIDQLREKTLVDLEKEQ